MTEHETDARDSNPQGQLPEGMVIADTPSHDRNNGREAGSESFGEGFVMVDRPSSPTADAGRMDIAAARKRYRAVAETIWEEYKRRGGLPMPRDMWNMPMTF